MFYTIKDIWKYYTNTFQYIGVFIVKQHTMTEIATINVIQINLMEIDV